MPSTRPNLFDHARTERCQDAFLAWLCEWADPRHAAVDPLLHRSGQAFIDHLYQQHESAPPEYSGVRVETQYHNMDLVVFLRTAAGENHAILIEDKVFAGLQGGQMDRYIDRLRRLHPEVSVLPIHLQTWFIGHPVPSSVFRSIDLQGMFDFLLRPEWDGITDPIFTGFRHHLKRRADRTQQYTTLKVADWKADQWMGFFNVLRKRLEAHGCSATFEQNPRSSGPLAICRMENVLLPGDQLSCVELYGKAEPVIAVRTNGRDPEMLDRLYRQLLPLAEANGIPLKAARPSRSGNTAMAAIVEAGDLLAEDGRIDIDRVELFMAGLNQILAARTVAAARASLVE